MNAPRRCPRCGVVAPLPALAAKARKAQVELEGMRLVVPDIVRRNLAEVAAALRCHAGLCGTPKDAECA
jgi:hypothetical protein